MQASEGKKQLNAKFAIDNQGVIGDAFRIQQILNNLISSLLCNCDGGVRFGGVSVSPVPAESRLKSGFFARKTLRDRLF